MATTTTKPDFTTVTSLTGVGAPGWQRKPGASARTADPPGKDGPEQEGERPSQSDALQALLAFAALHEQLRRRKSLAARHAGFDAGAPSSEFEPAEQFVLDDVLQLVAERAVAITGADGLAIALAENNEIVLRAAAGTVRPDVGARIDRNSAFSGACFRQAQVVTCDDTETDPRVNTEACRRLGARSMIAVPLCGRRRVIGVLEAFFAWPFGFNDSDVRNLSLLAELVLGALKPEDEDRFAESAQAAETKLEVPAAPAPAKAAVQTATAPAVSPAITKPPAVTPTIATPAVSAAPSPASAAGVLPKPTASVSAPLSSVAAPTAKTRESVAPAAPVVPAIVEKPAGLATAAVLDEPAVLSATASADAHAEKTIRRPGMLFLLLGIVITVAFAAGAAVWWKFRTGQPRSEALPAENTSAETGLGKSTVPVPEAVAVTAATSGVSATPASDLNTPLDASLQSTTPASAQELSKLPRVTGVRHWSSADSSSIVLDLEDQVQYEAHRLASPDRIYFDLHDTQLAPELAGKSIEVEDEMLYRIRVAQPVSGMTRVVLETKANTNFSVSLETNPYRLVVEVRKIGAIPKGAVNLFPNAETEKNLLTIVVPPPTKEDLQLRARVPKMRIVVDAGHGGWDLGTVGRKGLLEKDLVLEIAQRLGKLLETRLGAEVIYTRQDDNYIPLDERAQIANLSQADLFISVHANYSDLPSARGVETYYTNFFSAPGSKEVGSKETGPKEIGSKDAVTQTSGVKNLGMPTLSSADLRERTEQSRRLAASVQRSLYGTLSVRNPGLRDRGVKEAGFVVLTESAMPGILAEVSFVSSPTDEQKLRSDGYREQIAEALYRGIARYAGSSKGVKLASAKK